MQLGFKAANNVEEYEALFIGLRMAYIMKVTHIKIHSDSQLVVNQVRDNY